MATQLPYRKDLQPLCPADLQPMVSDNNVSPTFKCIEKDCQLHWKRHEGYFHPNPEDITKNEAALKFLKTAYVAEHGYFYLGSADSTRRTWLCSVEGCENTTIES
jgi:hypothetical protein